MRRCVLLLSSICAAGLPATLAVAQSISFSPTAPRAGDTVRVLFSEPFDCAAPVPRLSARLADGFVFESLFPSGIVNCPIIPSPPPKTADFSVVLGVLPAGSYNVRWTMYVSDATGAPKLVSDSSAPLIVTATVAAPRPAPTLSPASLLLLGVCCALAVALRRRDGARPAPDDAEG